MYEDNEVIIIGGNHFNTLSVIRSLGSKKIKFITLIHENNVKKEDLMVAHSKYAKELYVIKNDEPAILNFLVKHKNEAKKQVIIPCSDLAEYTLDNNYEKLCAYYYLPGFVDEPGKVCKMMDKYEQKKWADKHNIPMAKTWKINKNDNDKKLEQITFPCIVKPCLSAFGKKSDIKVCRTMEELSETLRVYFNNNYDDLLIQEFLNKEFELCVLGCILENGKQYRRVIKKLREHPKTGGSASYAKFINEKEIHDQIDKIVDTLIKDGYCGLYDIDIIKNDDKYYLNEINFRNSGNNYALLKAGINAPYIYYLEKYDKDLLKSLDIRTKNIYIMDDISNLKSWKQKEISLVTFIKDFFRARAHSVFSMSDLDIIFYYLKKKGK